MARQFDTLIDAELRRRDALATNPYEPRRNINSIVDPATDTFIDRFRPFSSDPAGDYQKEQRFDMQRKMQEIDKGVPIYRPGTPRFGDPTKVISQASTGTATDALPPGFSYRDEPAPAAPTSDLPPGFSYRDEAPPVAAKPAVSLSQSPEPDRTPAPTSGLSQLPEDPAERAALMQRRSASGARQEGAATRAIEGVVPAVGREINRLGEVAKQAVTTGDIPPKEALESAMMLNPASVAYRTGMGVARAALTPAEVAARETGVLSIPRAADAGPMKQAIGRGLAAAPVGGGPLRAAAEKATGELEAAGTAAAARPTGVVPTQNLAGSQVRRGIEKTIRDSEGDVPPKLQAILGKSNEDMIGTIARMAGDVKTGANINILAQVRSAVPIKDWRNVQGALIDRMGQSPGTGQFDPKTWLRNYGSVSDRGKNILFGREGDALRVHLDAIEAVSRRAPTWQQFQREKAALGTRVGVAALAGVGTVMAPLTVLGSVIPMSILSRSLAKPATAAPIAQWSRAYERVVRTQGAPQAIASFTIATRNLNNTLGTDVSADDLLKGGARGQSVE